LAAFHLFRTDLAESSPRYRLVHCPATAGLRKQLSDVRAIVGAGEGAASAPLIRGF
jgi:hypothetical protein